MSALTTLRDPRTIRQRCTRIWERGVAKELEHFRVDLTRLDAVADRVAAVTRAAYPNLDVPAHSRWRHLDAGGSSRTESLPDDPRALLELVIVSVLIDAGAGPAWRYHEAETGLEFSRSEGLAVASVHLFASGLLSAYPGAPRVDGARLLGLTDAELGTALQVTGENPIVGLSGRRGLLQRLGHVITDRPDVFPNGRLGDLLDRFPGPDVSAVDILTTLLTVLGPIWPGGLTIEGENPGDVWPHPQAGGKGATAGLVPFHKLSQWLAYSVVESLERVGRTITDLHLLTGLPEYRNGGLLVDLGLLAPRAGLLGASFPPSAPEIIEWRALTVIGLDRVAERVRHVLDRPDMPLTAILQGGTWQTGRDIAAERRPGGPPPIRLRSDGTVF